MEQEGFEWHRWRMGGIGSSDASVIMGVSPYKTVDQLYLEKIGQAEEPESNFAMLRGKELEPIARANVELLEDIDFEPVTMQMKEHKFMRASLDGWNEDRKIVLEIKCLGREKHAMALAGEIPIEYIYQLAHQILVSGCEEIWYYSFTGTEGHLIKKKSIEFKKECADLFQECKKFWGYVRSKTPPSKPQEKEERCPLKEIWNENCGSLSKIRALRGRRGTMARARWKEKPSKDYWTDVVKSIASSPFLTGENAQGWKADFDFFVRPDTQDKVLEGKYNKQKMSISCEFIQQLINNYNVREPLPEEEMNKLSELEVQFLAENGGRYGLSQMHYTEMVKLARQFQK